MPVVEHQLAGTTVARGISASVGNAGSGPPHTQTRGREKWEGELASLALNTAAPHCDYTAAIDVMEQEAPLVPNAHAR